MTKLGTHSVINLGVHHMTKLGTHSVINLGVHHIL